MIPAILYQYIYLLVVLVLTVISCLNYASYTYERLQYRNQKSNYLSTMMLAAAVAIFIGLRPLHRVFIDMMNYHEHLVWLSERDFEFNWEAENIIFDNIEGYFGTHNISEEFFFLTISIINFGSTFIAIRKFFPNDSFFAYLVFLGAFSTFSYATNGIKAGAAAGLFLCAMAYFRNIPLCTLFCLLSLGFHHSMIVPIFALICAKLCKNNKIYLGFWIFSALMAVLHITIFQELFSSFGDDSASKYLDVENANQWDLKAGQFRFDFLLYSASVILVGYFAIYKYKLVDSFYTAILNIYTLTNSVWLLCMYANFTNRIAYLSWSMIPVLLIYPYLKDKLFATQYKWVALIAILHLAFTLFMAFIYY